MAGIRLERFIWQTTKGLRVDNKGRRGEPLLEAKDASKGDRPSSARKLRPSAELAAITGSAPLPRSEVTSKVWDHIRKNNLQNPKNKREILADEKLRKVFGTDKCTMFEMNKFLSKHLNGDVRASLPHSGARPKGGREGKKRA